MVPIIDCSVFRVLCLTFSTSKRYCWGLSIRTNFTCVLYRGNTVRVVRFHFSMCQSASTFDCLKRHISFLLFLSYSIFVFAICSANQGIMKFIVLFNNSLIFEILDCLSCIWEIKNLFFQCTHHSYMENLQ